MSRGKYSPNRVGDGPYTYNCYGQEPTSWNKEVAATGVVYDEKTMFDNYDRDGFDSYGYSCFDEDGNYVGIGAGVDRNGYTELDYLTMSDDEFYDVPYR
jgi:hypothetical protein